MKISENFPTRSYLQMFFACYTKVHRAEVYALFQKDPYTMVVVSKKPLK